MKKEQLWTIVIVAVVVAVIASLITASITGNVIKQNTNVYGKYKIYTTKETYNKTETDERISDAITNVLDNVIADEVANFNSCNVVRTAEDDKNCISVCQANYPNQRCILGYININRGSGTSLDKDGSIIACGETGDSIIDTKSMVTDIDTSCFCCHTL